MPYIEEPAAPVPDELRHSPLPTAPVFSAGLLSKLDDLVQSVIAKIAADDESFRSRPSDSASPALPPRILISLFGPGGSGKTVVCRLLVDRLQTALAAYYADAGPVPAQLATSLPMDGFHLTKTQLSAMSDPERAHWMRGSEFTMDGHAFADLVRAIKTAGPATLLQPGPRPLIQYGTKPILAPDFDHSLLDPSPDAIEIHQLARVVLFEGLYLNLNKHPWTDVSQMMTFRWFIHSPQSQLRLCRRLFEDGVVSSIEHGWARAAGPDQVNRDQILSHMLPFDAQIDN